jgi:8-hydroxy-5-deazaflavin:NADPH oxidoreductase
MQNKPTIAVIGGTGDLGSGLAQLWAAAGYPVIVGSRAKERAQAKAQELVVQTDGAVRGDDNRGAAQAADIVVLCVPYSNHDVTLEDIKPAMEGVRRSVAGGGFSRRGCATRAWSAGACRRSFPQCRC